MASFKQTLLFVCLQFVAVVVMVVPVAQGAGVGGLKTVSLPDNKNLLISGTVTCRNNLPFPNAKVELKCGQGSGTLEGTATTNAKGQFSFVLSKAERGLHIRMGGTCYVVLVTPLGDC